jgi:hypothetical protein
MFNRQKQRVKLISAANCTDIMLLNKVRIRVHFLCKIFFKIHSESENKQRQNY